MFKLNLHAHTKYSDGHADIEGMLREYKKQGFTAAVITDHVYSADHKYSLNLEKYSAQVAEAYAMSAKHDFPVILGAEFSLHKLEEVVIIGQPIVTMLLLQRKNRLEQGLNGMTMIEDLAAMRKTRYPFFVSLCHPHLTRNEDGTQDFILKGGHKILNAFERINGGCDFFSYRRKDIPAEFEGLIPLSNSDAHSSFSIDTCYNLTNEPIRTEQELFDYKGIFKLYNSYGEVGK